MLSARESGFQRLHLRHRRPSDPGKRKGTSVHVHSEKRYHRSHLSLPLLLGGVLLLGLLPSNATAFNDGYPFWGPTGPCTYVWLNSVANSDGTGTATGATWSDYNRGAGPCQGTWGRPALDIRHKQDIYKWNGSAWVVCLPASTWTRNSATATYVSFGAQYVAICGPGYYANLATGHVYQGTSGWFGGTVWDPNYIYIWA